MIRIFFKNGKDTKLTVVDKFVANSWIYVENPSEVEIKHLAETFELSRDLIEDALDSREVPRLEADEEVAYIFTRFVLSRDNEIETAPMLLAIKKDCIITISPEVFPRMEQFLNGNTPLSSTHPTKVLLKILNEISDTFNDNLNALSKRIQNLSISIEKIRNRDIVRFIKLENILYDFNIALVRINTVLTTLINGKTLKFTETERDLIDDLTQDNEQLIHITQENIRTIVNIRDAHNTIMTNNLNKVIKLFTSLTVILTIPTIIGSFYGMNIKLPYQDAPYAFEAIVLSTAVICLTLLMIFIYQDWL